MTSNFLLGLGGTGAKCVEAFVRLATCGVGPDSSWIGLLDQDRSNGNTSRASRVLSEYAEVRTALRTPGSAQLGSSRLLSMALEKPREGWAWAPEERVSASLSTSVGYSGLPAAEQALVEGLFSDEERRMQLDEGFRQRPALGAALTLQSVTSASPVWKDLLTALQSAGHGVDVRVFLVASIFGGTGAAAFPTVARLLRAEIEQRGLGDQVKLGGALLLPYFSFPPPPEGDGPAIRPNSAAFMMQARGALEYYSRLQSQKLFDRLYVIGNDPLIPLRHYSEGGATQTNPPLLPELVAALAAIDFVQNRPEGDRGTVVAAGTGTNGPVGWEDLPFAGVRSLALRAEVAATVRMAVAWRQLYQPALKGEQWRGCAREAWYRRLLSQDGNGAAGTDASQGVIRHATAVFEGLLQWLVALNRGGAGDTRPLALIEDSRLAAAWTSSEVDAVPLNDSLRATAFESLVPPNHGPSLANVFSHMTYGPIPSDCQGLGRVLAVLRDACGSKQIENF